MAKPTFRDLVTSGTVMASAPVEEEQFRSIIDHVNEEFGLELEASKQAFELFQDRIRVVVGRFWDESQAVERKTVLQRLAKLTDCVKFVKSKLFPLRTGLQDQVDTEVVRLLIRAVDVGHRGRHPEPREQLETSLKVIEALEETCERALVLLSELPARRGQPALSWYDELVSLMAHVAGLLGIKVSTAGDRAEDPYATPFTIFVFEAEQVLPEEARSESLAGCARRIDRSQKRLRRPLRQNSRKTG
jgi:hypothetical protein